MKSKLAIFGGPKAIQTDSGDMFTWPTNIKLPTLKLKLKRNRGGNLLW